MTVETLRGMFVHELQQMYYVETELVGTLEDIASSTSDDTIRQGFEQHRGQTRDQVERLERVFEVMNEPVEARRCHAFDGLIEDRRDFLTNAAEDPDLIDMYNVGAGMKTERLEITAYEGLLMLADQLDLPNEATEPLDENLSEEKNTLRELKGIAEGSQLKQLISRLTG